MPSLGQIKTRIFKILDEYSKNGRCISPWDEAVADVSLRMNSVIDMCLRKIATLSGLECSVLEIHLPKGKSLITLPDLFAGIEGICRIDTGKAARGIRYYITDGKLCVFANECGDYGIVYRHYPESIENAADSTEITALDEYLCDALVYLAASELCTRDDGEYYSRLKFRFDEIMANRYNTDKLRTPPFNRFYAKGRCRCRL